MEVLDPASFHATPRFLLDAASLSLANDANVTAYTDLSGNGNNLTSSSTYPKYKTSVGPTGAMPAIRFNSGGATKVLSGSIGTWTGAGVTILMAIANWGGNQSAAYGGFLALLGSGVTDDWNTATSCYIGMDNTDPNIFLGSDSASRSNLTGEATTLYPSGGPFPTMVAFRYDSAGKAYFGGRAFTCANNAAVVPATIGFGQRYVSSAWTTNTGEIFDLLGCAIFDDEPDDTEFRADMNYMMGVIAGRLTIDTVGGGGGDSGGYVSF